MILKGYGWCSILIIEDWDFRVVIINATREYEFFAITCAFYGRIYISRITMNKRVVTWV